MSIISAEEMQFWNDLVTQLLNFLQIVVLAYLAVIAKRVEHSQERTERQIGEDA